MSDKSTKYVHLDTHKCDACWQCIDECKRGVLGKVDFWFHKHVKIVNAERCSGCKRCVDVCPNGVFEPLLQAQTAADR
jgi:NAD-dependent dihydropyrimidine dehydrogenase PreA subunit